MNCDREYFKKASSSGELKTWRYAVLAQFFQPDGVDTRILILIFHLIAALFDAQGRPLFLSGFTDDDFEFFLGNWIAYPAETGRNIPRRLVAGDEVLVKLLVGRWKDDPVVPVNAREIGIARIPEQRVAVPVTVITWRPPRWK